MEKPFPDRSIERLGTAETASIIARKLLLEVEGKNSKGINPASYNDVRGCDKILLPGNVDWREDLKDDLRAKFYPVNV